LSNYIIDRKKFSKLQNFQAKSFEDDFNISRENITIEYENRGYTVNDKVASVNDSSIQAMGIFSGAGGLDIGAQLAGCKLISSLDNDKDSVASMRENSFFNNANHFLEDIQNVNAKYFKDSLKKHNPEKLILIGGPPCQPFSKAGYWVTHKNRLGREDPRNMIGQYLRLISELQPDGFLLENVESLLHPKNLQEVHYLEESIDKLGYNFIRYKANAIDFGVPQKRKRVFFIASRNEISDEPVKTHGSDKEILINKNLIPYERVIDWIARYDAGKYFEKEEVVEGKTYYKEIMEVPPGKNYIALTAKAGYPNPKFIANKRFWNFLLKLHPYQPSWTIAAQPGPWVGPFHWSGRRLRVPEISAIQTFPTDYKFVGNRRSIQRQIGNAVPSLLGKAMVNHLINHIK